MEYLIIWFLFGIVSAVIASKKGRSGCGWFLLGVLLGPFGLILALVVSRREGVVEKKAVQNGNMKKCPYCAELIKVEAVKCRFCGEEQVSFEPSYGSMALDTITPSLEDRASIQEEEKHRAKTGEKVKKGKRIGFLPLLLIVFAALIVIGYIANKTSSPPKSPPSSIVRQSVPQKGELESTPKEPSQFIYTRTSCNIRKGPGTKYPVVGKAGKGEKLEYSSLEGNWYRLKVAIGEPQK